MYIGKLECPHSFVRSHPNPEQAIATEFCMWHLCFRGRCRYFCVEITKTRNSVTAKRRFIKFES